MPRLLDRVYRSLGTGFFFAALFGGGAVIATLIFPIVNLTTREARVRRDRKQYLIHLLFRSYIGAMRLARLASFDFQGRERLRDAPGRMLVANHPSLLDVVMLMALIPRSQCIVKQSLWDSPYLGRLVRGVGYISNALPSDRLLRACRESVEEGKCLIIFPEGTRSTPGEPMQLQRGFANIALLLGIDIQLATITCTPPTLLKGLKWYAIPPQRPVFCVRVGEMLSVRHMLDVDERPLAARKLVRKIKAYFESELANGRTGSAHQETDRREFEARGHKA
ncbi:1-acyl-sn-glycerol-3-phosphate acyltransferase [Bosea sp. F3-2]|uniref:lysophospholipid acyltransferase family protein n=1 Tax=Bosea sp. F3-2 TaxID=2599640 RepID=UPI0011EC807D|nr:lysophospholipid acyltransferase family protein [Bosea sp. F3-2]QEL25127.1 1-acyl-sn-glycerol-3-phosphate acyltransferase [Bosea sp. F3-2]